MALNFEFEFFSNVNIAKKLQCSPFYFLFFAVMTSVDFFHNDVIAPFFHNPSLINSHMANFHIVLPYTDYTICSAVFAEKINFPPECSLQFLHSGHKYVTCLYFTLLLMSQTIIKTMNLASYYLFTCIALKLRNFIILIHIDLHKEDGSHSKN